jgi:catechol 2,3-dioxygenase-like lactoylglutathione lyase family enzyme
MSSSPYRLPLALTALLVLGAVSPACRGDAGDAGGAADGETAELPRDGAGMEPRIVTEHPQDSPGRPAGGEREAAAIEPEPAAAWVPQLTVADVEASIEFYRGLGFEVAARQGDERAELALDGARLVLVAAADGGGSEEADTASPGDAAADDAAPADAAAPAATPPVLRLVDATGVEGGRTVRDPDGHRVAIPGG